MRIKFRGGGSKAAAADSGGMENFQVDVILNSLQDLKKVRDRNERRLAQECARRMDLESQLESLTPRHSEAAARKMAAAESLKVVSEQASLAEAQASSLEQRCREKREEVRVLNEKIEEQKREEEAALSEFSEKMTELADKFRAARAYYTEPHLATEMEDCDREIEEIRERVEAKKTSLALLTSELAQLRQQGDRGEGERVGVARKQWQTFHDMVTNERGVAKVELEREEQRLRLLRQQTTQNLAKAPASRQTLREE